MLTTEQLAADMGISARQVQRLRGAGMPCIPVGARAVRYDAATCKAWLQANPETITQCLSVATPKAASRSLSASAVSAYTDACRKAVVRVMPSASNPS
jgi:hypothetical protein